MAEKRDISWWPLVLLVLISLAGWIAGSLITRTPSLQRNYSEFLADLESGRFTQVEISETQLVGTLSAPTPEGKTQVVSERPPNVDDPRLMRVLSEKQVPIKGVASVRKSWYENSGAWLLFAVVIFLIVGGARVAREATQSGFGKSRAKIYDQYRHSDVTFKDVAGVDEAEAELVEVVDFLKNPAKYTSLGGRIPKGVLLVGPPGTGKTLLAKAVSGEAGVPFLYISGSEFMEMFVGVGAARVRNLFDQAKQRAPCIIFIDELDAIGKSRSAGQGGMLGHDERDQTLNQLLAEMDGFDSSSGVILIAATNTPEVLDAALLRAGRFDRQVLVDRPDVEGRIAILMVHASRVKLSPLVDLKLIAARTPGMVGADLANVINEGALLAARRQSTAVEMKDIEDAIDRVLLGLEKKHRVMSAGEKERVAYHEAGHAVVALSLPNTSPVHRVSIIPRSIGALGHTLQLPTEQRFLMTRPELEDQLTVMVGGRVAEELVYAGEVSTGAADDLERVSELARQMVTRFSMCAALGQLTYGRPVKSRFLGGWSSEDRNYSERTAEAIDDEVRRLSDGCYERARSILTGRREDLERLAIELVQKETVDRSRLEELIGARSVVRPQDQVVGPSIASPPVPEGEGALK